MNAFNFPRRTLQSDYSQTDPGDGEDIVVDRQFAQVLLTSGASDQTRGLADPPRVGIRCRLVFDEDGGGNITVTADSAYNTTGNTALVFSSEGDFVDLESVQVNGALRWQLGAYQLLSGPQAVVTHLIPVRELRVHDALSTVLPATASADDMGVITGTPGTHAPTLQGVDFGGTSTDEKCAFEFLLPANYVAGSNLTVRAKSAGMLTAISDGTATLDCEAWRDAGDGTVGSDICATTVKDINSLTLADKDFTITGTTLVPGDRIIVRLSFAGSDVGNLAVMIPTIKLVQVLVTEKL